MVFYAAMLMENVEHTVFICCKLNPNVSSPLRNESRKGRQYYLWADFIRNYQTY